MYHRSIPFTDYGFNRIENYDGATKLTRYETTAANGSYGAKPAYFRFFHTPTGSSYDEWSYTYNNVNAITNISSRVSTDYLSLATWASYTYNASGRLASYGLSGQQHTWQYAADPLRQSTVTAPDGTKTYYYYDNYNRLTRVAHPATSVNNPPGASDGVKYAYDT